MLTIFTPTYNRKKEIQKLYESLTIQSNKDFEWIIIDDGSEDDTKSTVENFIKTDCIDITYIKQKNMGKMKAHNRALDLAKGELFVCIDADDWLTKDAIETIFNYYDKIIKNKDVCGIMFLNLDGDTDKIVGTKFPEQCEINNYHDVYNRLGVTGDKTLVFKTDTIKKFPFPEIEKEKFVPEALVYNRISKDYKLLCVNYPIKRVVYLDNGYSKNYFKVCKENPKGQIIYYKELYEMKPTLYNVAAYDMYCIYAKKNFKDTIKEHPSKLKALIMYIPAYIKYIQKERKK